MSVYVHKKSTDGVYSFDFRISGRRFQGSTGKTARREAEKWEQTRKDEARREIATEKTLTGPRLTIEQACARYWSEKQADHVNADDLLRELEWLKEHFGAGTMLNAIDDDLVATMIRKRRGEPNQNFKSEKRLIAKATVNATIRVLRRLMNRAQRTWKANDVQVIDWSEHMLPEPQERVREANPDEEAALLAELGRGFEIAVAFAFRMGCRQMEILNFDQTDINWFTNRITFKGKGARAGSVPMPSDVRALLWGEKDHHPVKVFTFIAKRTRTYRNGASYVEGQRYPMTKGMLKYVFKLARKRAGVVDFRFHDTRHTAATRVLRETGNLRFAQRLLRHANIGTTAKYAHVLIDDLAEAMERMASPGTNGASKSPGKVPETRGGKP